MRLDAADGEIRSDISDVRQCQQRLRQQPLIGRKVFDHDLCQERVSWVPLGETMHVRLEGQVVELRKKWPRPAPIPNVTQHVRLAFNESCAPQTGGGGGGGGAPGGGMPLPAAPAYPSPGAG